MGLQELITSKIKGSNYTRDTDAAGREERDKMEKRDNRGRKEDGNCKGTKKKTREGERMRRITDSFR